MASPQRLGCPLRTPEQRREYRKTLHKPRGSSPAWKDTYRKRCMARLRDSRQKFLSRLRSPDLQTPLDPTTLPESPLLATGNGHETSRASEAIRCTVQEVMMEEWGHMRSELLDRKSEDDGYLDYVLGVMDELSHELVEEEQAVLLHYEQERRFDEESLCAAIDSLSTDEIICPICQRNVLHQNHHIIFCACGIRIDTAQDGVTLDYIRKQLEECSTQHSSLCTGKPIFSLETTLGLQNIIMNCSVCNFMFIVI